MLKKLLQIGCENFGRGGRSVIIYNLTEYLISKYKVDFLSTNKIVDESYIEKLKHRNGEILEYIPSYKNKVLKEFHRLISISKMIKDKYDLVHINADDAWEAIKSIMIAKISGVNKIVVHGHTANVKNRNSKLKDLVVRASQKYIVSSEIVKIACSIDAAQYMFGTDKDVTIIENGIDLEKYKFSEERRERLRLELGIFDENTVVYGTVGRISSVKNPYFILKFVKLLKEKNENFKFLWVGSGELEEEIHREADRLKLRSHLMFLGNSSQIDGLLNAFDVFILPSLYEGFGIVNIEAQASGLECFVSDTIPQNVKVNPNFTFLPLTLGAEGWIQKIGTSDHKRYQVDDFRQFSQKGFDLRDSASKLEEIYKNNL